MLNENPNNLNWKNKLEEVEGLSGETFIDKNATWNKLHHRLQPKRRRISAWWYWVAAACLLIAMFFPWLIASKKKHVLVKIAMPHAVQNKSIATETSPLQNKKNGAIAAAEIGKSTIVTSDYHLKKESTSAKALLQKVTIVSVALNNQNNIAPLQIIEQPLVQDIPVGKVIALLNNTKKLKVVHVNELGDPLPETHNRNYIADYRTLQIKLINQEVYTNSLPAINNPGFNIFKTTNAPSN